MTETPLIAICVPTCKRPVYLKGLLDSFARTVIKGFSVELIVADNDEAKSAEAVVTAATNDLPFPVKYVVEPKRGIASVRNRLVKEASRLNAEWLAFVDDDEFVEPDWLYQLYRTAVSASADAVAGRHVYSYEEDVPGWAQQSRRLQPEVAVTGRPVCHFSTANVLINLDAMLQISGPFDEHVNLSGGEDTVFAEQFRLAGFTAIQCAEPKVCERMSKDCATAIWRIQRGYRSGIVLAQVASLIEPHPRTIVEQAIGSAKGIAVSTIKLIWEFPRGRGAVASHLFLIAYGAGGLVGLVRGDKGFPE